MADATTSWEAAVRSLLDDPGQRQLVLDCFYDLPRTAAVDRYARSPEWQALLQLLPRPAGRALEIGAGHGIASADTRHLDHYRRLVERVQALGLASEFRLLGMIPYEDVIRLTSLSHAVVNPSFFEGWSTTVEEAKALGAPLALSDLGVHREQAGNDAIYFDPESPGSAAEALERALYRTDLAPAEVRRSTAAEASRLRVAEFAQAFALAARSAQARARNVASAPLPPVGVTGAAPQRPRPGFAKCCWCTISIARRQSAARTTHSARSASCSSARASR